MICDIKWFWVMCIFKTESKRLRTNCIVRCWMKNRKMLWPDILWQLIMRKQISRNYISCSLILYF
ncbi:hypothetical protein EVA_13115 [gut metagenome]|uniref:Uncharacterized protein n=1 Tax=gut metagenome TaxID=749906 RepID=J9FUW6_9ZZZZ